MGDRVWAMGGRVWVMGCVTTGTAPNTLSQYIVLKT